MSYFRMSFEIVKEIAVLKEGKNGWRRELNLISWNGGDPKYDIRWWPPKKTDIGKGATFTPEELFTLGEVIHTLPRDLHVQYQLS